MKLNNERCKVLHLGRKKSMHQQMLGDTKMEDNLVLVKKAMGVLVDTRWTMTQQCVFPAQMSNSLLDCIKRSFVITSREVILPLYSALVRRTWGTVTSSGLPGTGGWGHNDQVQKSSTKMVKELQHLL